MSLLRYVTLPCHYTPGHECVWLEINVMVDGQSLGPRTSYTFTNVQRNHTVEAAWIRYQIATSAGTGGSILPSSAKIGRATCRERRSNQIYGKSAKNKKNSKQPTK